MPVEFDMEIFDHVASARLENRIAVDQAARRTQDAIDEHRDEIDVVELARHKLRESFGGRVDERARGVALARAMRLEGRVDRLETLRIATRRDAERDLLGDALRHRVPFTQSLDAR